MLIGSAALLSTGCETESVSSSSISVSPSSATLTSSAPSVQLTASGGWNYRWSISNESYGALDKTSGSTVTYTAYSFGDGTNSLEQMITVSIGGSSTNVVKSASVNILQR